MLLSVRPQRILDFDIENRPLNYAGEDFTFSEITAIAWSLSGRKRHCITCMCLGEPDEDGRTVSVLRMLEIFRTYYDQADILTGHNILRHDLRILNGACLENGLGPLEPKLVCDTYAHLKRKGGVSGSQENLSKMLGIRSAKVGMSQADWREANRLTPEGIEKTRKRVTGDVRQHMALRKELLARDWLRPPRLWTP